MLSPNSKWYLTISLQCLLHYEITFVVDSAHVLRLPSLFTNNSFLLLRGSPPPDFWRNGDAFLWWCSTPVATTIAPTSAVKPTPRRQRSPMGNYLDFASAPSSLLAPSLPYHECLQKSSESYFTCILPQFVVLSWCLPDFHLYCSR